MCHFGIIRDRHILLIHAVGPIASGVLSGWCSAGAQGALLCLCDTDSKKCHKATTHNCDSMEESDILRPELILTLGLLRNISCSFAYVSFWYNKGPPHTFDTCRRT